MPDASIAGKEIQLSGADADERSDRQWAIGEQQRPSSAHVPHERTHVPNLPVVSPDDFGQAAGP